MNRIIVSLVTAAGLASAGCADGPGQRMNQADGPDPNRVATDAAQLQSELDSTELRTEDPGDAAIVKHDLYMERQEAKDEDYSDDATDK